MKVSVYTEKTQILENFDFESATLPTIDGEITLLDNHNPIIGILKPGKVKLINQEKKEIHIPLDNGFFLFRENTLTIIADKTNLTLEELTELQKKAIKARNVNIGQADPIEEKSFKQRKESENF